MILVQEGACRPKSILFLHFAYDLWFKYGILLAGQYNVLSRAKIPAEMVGLNLCNFVCVRGCFYSPVSKSSSIEEVCGRERASVLKSPVSGPGCLCCLVWAPLVFLQENVSPQPASHAGPAPLSAALPQPSAFLDLALRHQQGRKLTNKPQRYVKCIP